MATAKAHRFADPVHRAALLAERDQPWRMRIDLFLRSSLITAMRQYCTRHLPQEACGIISAYDGDGPTRFVPMRNVAKNPEHNYAFDPGQYLTVTGGLEASGERIVAVFHSHPTGPPQLSAQDVASAAMMPEWHQLLLAQGGFLGDEWDLSCWRVVDGTAHRERVCVSDG